MIEKHMSRHIIHGTYVDTLKSQDPEEMIGKSYSTMIGYLRVNGVVIRSRRKFSSGSTALKDTDVVVCGLARTPIGRIRGALSSLTAPELGAASIKEAIRRSGITPDDVEEVFMGNVVSAGIGQAPARQAALKAGLPISVACTTVNKVCASGMKAVMLSAMSISANYRQVVVAGGMESMSNVPYYLPGARSGYNLGHNKVLDGIVHDGLWDVYTDQHMGVCAEQCATKFSISRADQDAYAIRSYKLTKAAWDGGFYDKEVVPISVSLQKQSSIVNVDEEFSRVDYDKIPSLKPAFKKDGSVTAANSSKINDGASAMLIVSGKYAKARNLTPLFRILGYGDAAKSPVEFTTAPAEAVLKALKNAGMTLKTVDYHEINEAFAVVALCNVQLLGLDIDKVNVHGGAVALGHPIGSSGTRIIGAVYNVLKERNASIGCASICNGGGGASAVVIERLN